MNVGDVFVKANLNNSAFNNQVTKTVKSSENAFSKGFSKIGKIVASVFAIGAVIAFGKACVSVASQTQSAWIGLESILDGQGRSFSRAKEFLNDYTKDGLIPLTNAVTAYKNLASRGYDDKQIQQTLTSLKDAAAFGRQASYSYGDAIQTATEGLKNENSILVDNAGVTKNVAKMWEDYAKSIGKTSQSLTQQEKIAAEVNGILAETKFQVGDAAKYADTFSGSTARLSATFYRLKTVIGEVIMPIANLFLPILQKAMDKLIAFFSVIKQVMGALGLKSSKPISQSSKAYDTLGGSAVQAANNVAKASKKINKVNSAMNYDELNILNKSNNDSGGSSSASGDIGGGASIGDMMGEDTPDVISPKAQKIADNIKKAWGVAKNAFKTGRDLIVNAFNAINKATKPIRESLVNLYNTIDNIIPVSLIVTQILFGLIGSFIYLYNTSEIFRNSINEIANAFILALTPAIQLIAGTAIPDLINGFNNFIVIMQPLIDFVKGVMTDAWEKVLQPALMYIADTVLPTLIGTFDNLWNNVLVPFGEFIGAVLEPVVKILSDTFDILWKNVLLPLCDFIGGAFSKVFESVYEIYNKTLIPIINKAIEVFTWLWKNVLEPIVNFLWTAFKPMFETVCKTIGDIFGGLKQIFGGVLDFITEVFTLNWSKAWNGIKDIFGGIWDTLGTIIKAPLNLMLSGVESLINAIIKGFNFLKKSINKISFDIPDWVPGIGGQKWGFNLSMSDPVQLPRLAQGGWVEPNKPRPVVVGDNKREGEIISPESKIYEQNRKAIRDEMKNFKSQSGVMEFHFYHHYEDGRTIIEKINTTQIKDGKITLLT